MRLERTRPFTPEVRRGTDWAVHLKVGNVLARSRSADLSLCLRYEGADLGVKVSVICPGHVGTNIYQAMTVVNVPRERVIAGLPSKPMSVSDAVRIIMALAYPQPQANPPGIVICTCG